MTTRPNLTLWLLSFILISGTWLAITNRVTVRAIAGAGAGASLGVVVKWFYEPRE